MPKKKKLEYLPQQLLVEGDKDRHVIWALCQKHQLPQNFSVELPKKAEGIEALLRILPIKLKNEEIKTLGIVVDADLDLTTRWQSVSDKLQESGYQNIPKEIPQTGWIHKQAKLPKIGVWVMPNNQLPGMLEDFVTYLIPDEDILKVKAEAILQEIETAKINPYSLTHHSKALIHTWLAWQKKPGMPMGQAITAKALSNNSEIANIFIIWLQKLFSN
ncbi:conserved hypothetical protein [Hyella patelloides LEGE 07179]|uniref:DUF4435 domain-containing protein n=1 Tax=Hyella patelloides LEGE 07179 TaxID=945734 RepID=A0A563VIX9_9CYAN|nr:DUF3226 domain-containing protein [Hyella patelloides]VEP11305.1 conserved hypothetical protein [Hyella patelloides LEGE 07179]